MKFGCRGWHERTTGTLLSLGVRFKFCAAPLTGEVRDFCDWCLKVQTYVMRLMTQHQGQRRCSFHGSHAQHWTPPFVCRHRPNVPVLAAVVHQPFCVQRTGAQWMLILCTSARHTIEDIPLFCAFGVLVYIFS